MDMDKMVGTVAMAIVAIVSVGAVTWAAITIVAATAGAQ